MAGSKSLPHWQQVFVGKLKEIADHPDFDNDWGVLYSTKDTGRLFTFNLERMVRKYKLPRGGINYLKKFILLEEANLDNITPPIFIVSEIDSEVLPSNDPILMMEAYQIWRKQFPGRRVLLDITQDTQRKDIDDFLDQHFEKTIKPKLKLLDKNRTSAFRHRQNDKKFYTVAKLYSEKKIKLGRKRGVYDEIQRETGYKPSEIKKYIANYRAQREFSPLTPSQYRNIMGQQSDKS